MGLSNVSSRDSGEAKARVQGSLWLKAFCLMGQVFGAELKWCLPLVTRQGQVDDGPPQSTTTPPNVPPASWVSPVPVISVG